MRYPTSTIHGSSSRWITGISCRGHDTSRQLARFGVSLPCDYETIGGLVMERLGRLPRRGDVIEDQGWRLRVRSTEGRRSGGRDHPG